MSHSFIDSTEGDRERRRVFLGAVLLVLLMCVAVPFDMAHTASAQTAPPFEKAASRAVDELWRDAICSVKLEPKDAGVMLCTLAIASPPAWACICPPSSQPGSCSSCSGFSESLEPEPYAFFEMTVVAKETPELKADRADAAASTVGVRAEDGSARRYLV